MSYSLENFTGLLEKNIDNRGKTPPLSPTGYPLIEVKHIQEDHLYPVFNDTKYVDQHTWDTWFRAHLEPGDILFSTVGSIARSCIVPHTPRFCIAQNVLGFRVNRSKADPRFLYYAIKGPFFQQEVHGRTIETVQKSIKVHDLKTCRVPLPPLPEQKAIAAVLGALDDKIDLNRRMNATLEAMARAFFKSWFVDFDPVRAKLDGRQPTGLDAATTALFPSNFEHTEDGLLPVGWRYAAIEEICDLNAWTLGKNNHLETLEYVEISEVSRGNIANIVTYSRGEEPSRARRRLRHGDTVLSTVRPDRRSYFLALNPPENRVASTGFAVLTPNRVPWSFIHAAMTQPEVSEHLGQMADGGAYPAVRPETIGVMQIALPNQSKILEAFHRTCAPLFEQAEANRTQSRTLATLRDTLLPKLLKGELRTRRFKDGLE